MLIPPFFIDCVTALGNLRPGPQPGGNLEWTTLGTGFFYGSLINPQGDPNTGNYLVFLVTAKHVVQSHLSKGLEIRVRVNSKDANHPAQDFRLPSLVGGPGQWFFHPNSDIDIAVIDVNWDILKQHKIEPGFFLQMSVQHLIARN
jgi:hypothetical protein